MVAREESVSDVGSDAESGWSGVSDNSSTDSECTDIEASIDLTLPMMRFGTWQMTYTTLTSDGTPEVSPVRMRLVFYYWMDKRSCKSWCICPEPGR